MQAYLYQAIAVTSGLSYQFSFDYSSDSSVVAGTLMYAGLSAIAGLVAQTDVGALPNAVFADFEIGPSESGTKTFEVVAATGQDALFLTNILAGAGTITFDNVSLKATNSVTGDGFLENSTMSPMNLTPYVNQASLFIYTYLPTGADFNSIQLRWGSSATDYYFLSVTKNQGGNTFVNGWNLLQFDWKSASSVGTPDASAINYVRVTWEYDGILQTGVRLNGVNNILGSVLSYEYYSKFLFRDSATGAFQENVSDDSNLVNLDTESYNLLFNKVAEYAVQQQQGLDATFFDGPYFKGLYDAGVLKYKQMYKSEIQKPQSVYYGIPAKGYGRWFGRGWNN